MVEGLLDSPHFGERQAQDWFDLARFADTSGYAADRTRNVWPYRDWVIAAFNENMPFDRFSIDQLAGDLLPGATPEQRVASAFHRHAMQAKGNNPRKEEFRIKGIVDRLEATGRTWLGLTLECAECHDHKHDPISQREYYELFAIFNNVPHLGAGYGVHGPLMKYTPPAVGLAKAAPTIEVPVMDELPQPRETHLLVRGDFKNKGERVTAGTPKILPPLKAKGSEPPNRLDFARWLFSADQPLTARVAVNRIWRHHFGEGLVRTVADFGRYGDRPSHPELLDWLAVEFIESGWDIKHIVRLIVNSSTYRQSSLVDADALERDPANRLLARQGRFRFPAETIRDNALAIGGLLNGRMGGAVSRPYQPAGYYAPLNFPKRTYKADATDSQHRRGVYMHWQRQFLHPMLRAFDAPTREECTAQRPVSNTPLAALTLMNDPTFVEAAKGFAVRILSEGGTTRTERLRWAWQAALGRTPAPDELKVANEFVQQALDRYADDAKAADELLSVGLTSVPSHLSTTETAGWASVALAFLNLSEVITRN